MTTTAVAAPKTTAALAKFLATRTAAVSPAPTLVLKTALAAAVEVAAVTAVVARVVVAAKFACAKRGGSDRGAAPLTEKTQSTGSQPKP